MSDEVKDSMRLRLVSPIHDDALEYGYRCCDFCFESAVDDINSLIDQGKQTSEEHWRKFYLAEDEHGLTVCENCIESAREG